MERIPTSYGPHNQGEGRLNQAVTSRNDRRARKNACDNPYSPYPGNKEVPPRGEAVHPDPILDTRDAGTAAGVSDRRIRQLVQQGKIENVGTPRQVRVRLSEVTTVIGDPLRLTT